MFRKIVTELAYSPALAGNLGFYIKQLRNESSKRQIGLIFIALAVVVQLFATLFPPESANSSNPAGLIEGNINSIDEYLAYYDQNTTHIRDLLNSLGIERREIQNAQRAEISDDMNTYIWSSQDTREDESRVYFFTTLSESSRTAYFQPSPREAVDSVAYISSSQQTGKFAITETNARLITEKPPVSQCQSWLSSPDDPLKINSRHDFNDTECGSLLHTSLSGQKVAASSKELGTLEASERIAYTVTIENTGQDAISVLPSVNLEDALEYSRILDYGGGEYNFDTKYLGWTAITLDPGEKKERTFIVQLLPTIPATASGTYLKRSYDCEITLSFGNQLSSPVNCPPAKYIEMISDKLPNIPIMVNVVSSGILLSISIFLYARSKQLLTELYIIRHNHLGGI